MNSRADILVVPQSDGDENAALRPDAVVRQVQPSNAVAKKR